MEPASHPTLALTGEPIAARRSESVLPNWEHALPMVLAALVAAPVLLVNGQLWARSPSLSHGPILLLLAAVYWWREKPPASAPHGGVQAAVVLLPGALLYVIGFRLDIDFFKSASLPVLLAGAAWALFGREGLRRSLAPLGLLLLSVPWPTSATDRLAFPLQLASASYAAMLAGCLGIPVEREGVHLSVVPQFGGHPTYQVLIGRQCSGLASLFVLLALAYLLAWRSPLRLRWRVLLFLLVLPLAPACNALRLTLVLAAGAWSGPAAAQWIHDHETFLLLFLCGGILAGARALLMAHTAHALPLVRRPLAEERKDGGCGRPCARALSGVLALLLAAAFLGRGAEAAGNGASLNQVALPYSGWAEESVALDPGEAAELHPESSTVRRYRSRNGEQVELAVITGRGKDAVHSPTSCMRGGGWELLSLQSCMLSGDRSALPASRALMSRNGEELRVTFFFTDGIWSSESLLAFQCHELLLTLMGRPRRQSQVRITVPVSADLAQTDLRSDDFARAVLPRVMERLAQRASIR